MMIGEGHSPVAHPLDPPLEAHCSTMTTVHYLYSNHGARAVTCWVLQAKLYNNHDDRLSSTEQ